MEKLINKKTLIVLLLLLFIFFIMVPLIVSVSYGNIPLYDNNSLESSDIIVSNNTDLNENELSFITNNTYTWPEIKQYIIRREITFLRVFRNVAIISGVAIVAVMTDRIFLRR